MRWLISLILVAFVSCATVSQALIVGQSLVVAAPLGDTILAEQTSTVYEFAAINGASKIAGQSFQVSTAGTANKVAVWGRAGGASNVTIRIYSTIASTIDDYIATGTLAYAGVAVAEEIVVTMTTGVALSTGVTYYLSVESDAAYASRIFLKGSNESAYADGEYYATSTGWPIATPSANIDLYFKVIE
jgi:hypothetical protein